MNDLEKTRYKPTNSLAKRPKWGYKLDWTGPVELTDVHVNHGGTCVTGGANQINAQSRAGGYVAKLPQMVAYFL